MNFADWEPVYEAILADFGYDRTADERVRDVLGSLTDRFDLDELAGVAGSTVAIAGAGPSLYRSVGVARSAETVIAASTAADTLLDAGVTIDCHVTDLDGNPATARRLSRAGVPVAVHAHGDNLTAVEDWVPQFDAQYVLPTTQAAPRGPVRNFGGFTDGDRAAFLADHLGATALVFIGWDFDDATVGPVKRRKLRWAERLLAWLERRRNERFAVLDGRREALELPSAVD